MAIRRYLVSVAAAMVAVVGASCGADDTSAPTPSAGTDSNGAGMTGDVTVFAAASLTTAFTELGDAFMVDNPDAVVTFNFAGSSDLVAQIGEGAPVDVFASADRSNMAKVTDAGDNASDPVVFATNVAEIIVESENPRGITGVADLADENLIVVQCAPEVPCGKYAAQIFENAGISVTPKSLEQNVKAVVTKVVLGEVDAGIVYRTDVLAAGDAAGGVEIPDDLNVVAEYPIVVAQSSANAAGAAAFIEYVMSDAGQEILATYGFSTP